MGTPCRSILLAAALAAAAFAQIDRCAITGAVLDPLERIVQGSRVTAVQAETGAERTTESNSRGVYNLTGLAPGTWTVAFTAAGFGTTRYENFALTIGQT